MHALITGVGGFVGQHLAEHLSVAGDNVTGAALHDVAWRVPSIAAQVRSARVDLTSVEEVRRLIASTGPDRIYHLAAQSSVAESFRDPVGVLRNNIEAQVNLLEAVRDHAPAARVLIVSSSEVYGRSIDSATIDEHAELRPENPYAVSKAAQDLIGYQYWVASGLHVVRLRPFNHFGPGQSDRFVASSFARQIAEIEVGARDPIIQVGNLDAQRDFTDVRDMVRAYRLALERGEAGAVYNVGQGVPVAIREVLARLLTRARVPIEVRVDPDRLRQSDAPLQVCDRRRFTARTGWEPVIPIDSALDDILDFWRATVGAQVQS